MRDRRRTRRRVGRRVPRAHEAHAGVADEHVELPAAFARSASIARSGKSTNTPFASTGASSRTPGKPRDRLGEPPRHRVGVRRVRAATRRLRASPIHGAARKRIFDASCPPCLRRRANSSASARSKNTIASPNGMPFFVPPKRQHVDAGAPRDVGGRAAERRHGVGEARAVEVHLHAARVRDVARAPHLGRRVDGAELGRLRQRQRARPRRSARRAA